MCALYVAYKFHVEEHGRYYPLELFHLRVVFNGLFRVRLIMSSPAKLARK